MIWLVIPLFFWSLWLGWRWWRMLDPEDDGAALRDEWRWWRISLKWLVVVVFALFMLRTGCYSCEACGRAGVETSVDTWKTAAYASSAEFWRVWREVCDLLMGVWW